MFLTALVLILALDLHSPQRGSGAASSIVYTFTSSFVSTSLLVAATSSSAVTSGRPRGPSSRRGAMHCGHSGWRPRLCRRRPLRPLGPSSPSLPASAQRERERERERDRETERELDPFVLNGCSEGCCRRHPSAEGLPPQLAALDGDDAVPGARVPRLRPQYPRMGGRRPRRRWAPDPPLLPRGVSPNGWYYRCWKPLWGL
jgi:hypothetical protein